MGSSTHGYRIATRVVGWSMRQFGAVLQIALLSGTRMESMDSPLLFWLAASYYWQVYKLRVLPEKPSDLDREQHKSCVNVEEVCIFCIFNMQQNNQCQIYYAAEHQFAVLFWKRCCFLEHLAPPSCYLLCWSRLCTPLHCLLATRTTASDCGNRKKLPTCSPTVLTHATATWGRDINV